MENGLCPTIQQTRQTKIQQNKLQTQLINQ